MGDKKKIIWWERTPSVLGADQSRIRGSHDGGGHGRRRRGASPYYGPISLRPADDTEDGILPGIA
jgi:hypothetical protein